ncbi:MAG: tetratricopeptide repeat protein [Pseudomonadota bacterium]
MMTHALKTVLVMAFLATLNLAEGRAQEADEPTTTDGSVQSQPADDDVFELDPALAFEAFLAGNHARALDLAITFAGRGDIPSMRLLGQLYQNGIGITRDAEEAAAWYQLAAEAGDPEAQVLLATMKLDGVDIELDETGAAKLLREAQLGGSVEAKQMLGMLMLEGRGVDRDIPRAARMISEAADAGNPAAQYTLGVLYEEGLGVLQDSESAYIWYERAARGGDSEAQVVFALGIISGIASDPELSDELNIENAIFWLRRAAEAGNPIAENRLAHAYAQGLGVPLDPVQAAYFHARAVSGGLTDAALDSFVGSLTDEQRSAAQSLIARDNAPPNPFD